MRLAALFAVRGWPYQCTTSGSCEGDDMRIGYKLATEAFGPKELIRQAVLAERAGFDFV